MDEVEYYKKRYELVCEELDKVLQSANTQVVDIDSHLQEARADFTDMVQTYEARVQEYNDLIQTYEDRISDYNIELQKIPILERELDIIKKDITRFFDQFDWGDEKSRAYIIKARHDNLVKVIRPMLAKLRNHRYPKQTNDFADHIIIPDFERDVR